MRIKAIQLSWFRGAADPVSLHAVEAVGPAEISGTQETGGEP
jgi:hypothetical protein